MQSPLAKILYGDHAFSVASYIWHNVQNNRRQLTPGANLCAIPGALITFEAHCSAQGPFFRAILGTISFSAAISATMSGARYYKSNN
jgi:hypothetical protein